MKYLLDKKLQEPKLPEFIVLNELAQVFTGLIGGYPVFSDNWNEAKPFQQPSQIKHLKHGTSHQLEIHYI